MSDLITDSSGNIYAVGAFTTIGGISANRIAKWDPTTSAWSALGSGLNASAEAMGFLGSDLYVTGTFTTAGGVSVGNVAKWDGTSWSAVGGATTAATGIAGGTSIEVVGSDIYVASWSGSASWVSKLVGTSWSRVGGSSFSFSNKIYDIGSDGTGRLYAVGAFPTYTNQTAVNSAAVWNGTTWERLGNGPTFGLNNTGRVVASVRDASGNVDPNRVYIGGQFASAGGNTGVPYLAIYDYSTRTFSAVGTTLTSWVYDIVQSGTTMYAATAVGFYGVQQITGLTTGGAFTGAWATKGPALAAFVDTIALDGAARLYAGGTFVTASYPDNLVVMRPLSTDATLTNLVPSTGSLSPTFTSGTTDYSMTVCNATSSVTLTPTATSSYATIKVNATTTASGSASAALALTAGATRTVPVLVTAEDGTTQLTYNVAITRPVAVAVSTASLPAATSGQAYSAAAAASGGRAPYTWSVTTGTLPSGLSLDTATGVISGTPTAATTSTSSFTLTATDSCSQTAAKPLSIVTTAPVAITTNALPYGTVGTSYSSTVAATGGNGSTYTWSVTGGSLPAGLSLNTSNGAITGTPSAAGSSTVTIRSAATGALTNYAERTYTINVVSPVSITAISLPTGTTGTAYSQGLSATGGDGTYAWSLDTGSQPLPTGLTLNSDGTITGTPSASGTFTFTAKVVSAGVTSTQSFTIVIAAPLSIGSYTSGGAVGSAYTSTPSVTGGSAPVTFAVTNGALPAGLSLNTSTGAITGTPTTAGTYGFTVTATDSTGRTSSTVTSLVVSSTATSSPVTITTASLPTITQSTPFSAGITAVGGTNVASTVPGSYTWAVSAGSLPAGLSLNTSTGVISGTPTGSGAYDFTVTATDTGTPALTASQQFTGTVIPALSLTTTTLPGASMGTAYSTTLAASGGSGSNTWSISSGALPAGLALNSSTGVISGTPATSGDVNIVVTVTDSVGNTSSRVLSLVVGPVTPVTVTTTTVPQGTVNQAYTTTLQATGGPTGTYTWAVTSGSLPAGLSLNTSTGVISGTPSAAVTGSVTVQATDGSQSDTQVLSFVVAAALQVTTSSLPNATLSTAYNQSVSASGGSAPYTWSVSSGSLPSGLSLDPSSGAIAGTPSATGTSAFTVQVVDSQGRTATAVLNLSVLAQPLSIATTTLPSLTEGTAMSQTTAATGGTAPYTWSVAAGSLPAGLTLVPATGVISGTPTTPGAYSFTLEVTDATNVTAQQIYSGTVTSAGQIGPTPTPTPTDPVVVPPVDPTPPQFPIIGPIAVVPGSPNAAPAMTVGGQPVTPVIVAKKVQGTLRVSAVGASTVVQAQTPAGVPIALSSTGVVTAVPNGILAISAQGYAVGSSLEAYLFPGPLNLGSATVAGNGTVALTARLPGTLKPGTYVLQVNGYDSSGHRISTSVTITVRKAAVAQRSRHHAVVYFAPLSSVVDQQARRELRRLVHSIPARAQRITVQSTGFVQPDGNSTNDLSLSTARATNVAGVLKQLGLHGTYRISGAGAARINDPVSRRVTVTVTYRF